MCIVQSVVDAQLLAEKGCEIDIEDENGQTGLQCAVQGGDLPLVQFFLDHGARADHDRLLLRICWLASLGLCTRENKVAIVKLLFDHGAPINLRNDDGETLLSQSIAAEDSEMVELALANGANVQLLDSSGESVLHQAVQDGAESLLSVLLDHGRDVDHKTNEWETPLHIAASQHHAEIAEMLLDHRANIHEETKEGDTALLVALKGEGVNIRPSLNRRRAKPYQSTEVRRERMVSLLLHRGADANDKTKRGDTALHIAAKDDRFLRYIDMFVEAGTDLCAINKLGQTTFDVAEENGSEEVAECLEAWVDSSESESDSE